jgi:cell division protein FtsN
VQLGAFVVRANAERLRDRYAARFGSAQIAVKQGNAPLYRVLVGREHSIADAQRIADQLVAGGDRATVVRLDETLTDPPAAATRLPDQQ